MVYESFKSFKLLHTALQTKYTGISLSAGFYELSGVFLHILVFISSIFLKKGDLQNW